MEDAGIHDGCHRPRRRLSTVRVNWRGFGSSGVSSPGDEFVTRTFEIAALQVDWGQHSPFQVVLDARRSPGRRRRIILSPASGRARSVGFRSDFEMIEFGISDRVVHHADPDQPLPVQDLSGIPAPGCATGSVAVPSGNPNHALDDSWERFQKLDLNADPDRSIRRFDAAVDESLALINTILAQGSAKTLSR